MMAHNVGQGLGGLDDAYHVGILPCSTVYPPYGWYQVPIPPLLSTQTHYLKLLLLY